MSEEAFTKAMREFTKRRPFLPFFVDLMNGQRFLVDYPSVVFSEGEAGFLKEDGGLIEFTCDEVHAMTLAIAEASK